MIRGRQLEVAAVGEDLSMSTSVTQSARRPLGELRRSLRNTPAPTSAFRFLMTMVAADIHLDIGSQERGVLGDGAGRVRASVHGRQRKVAVQVRTKRPHSQRDNVRRPRIEPAEHGRARPTRRQIASSSNMPRSATVVRCQAQSQ